MSKKLSKDKEKIDGHHLGFIVGHYKSGSTWLINLLSLHPDIVGVGETHVFRHSLKAATLEECTDIVFNDAYWGQGGVKNYPKNLLANMSLPIRKLWRHNLLGVDERPTNLHDIGIWNQKKFKEYLLQSSDPEEYCRRFYGYLYKFFQPEKYLIEKTPNNIFEVPRIKEIFPDSKLIAIYRDGRDFVISERFFLAKKGLPAVPIEASALSWCNALEAQLEYEKEYKICTLKYEDLLAESNSTVEFILNYLDLDISSDLVSNMVEKSTFEFTTGRKAGQENRNQFYRKGIAGDWKNHFSEKDKEIFKEVAGEMLIRVGYEKNHNW